MPEHLRASQTYRRVNRSRLVVLRSPPETPDMSVRTLRGQYPLCEVGGAVADDLSEASAYGKGEALAYFEVLIDCGGLFDQVAVGVTMDSAYPVAEFAGYRSGSLAFHSDDGKVYLNGKAISQSLRYGTHDVIGCGVTALGDVFITLNQVPLPLIHAGLMGLIFPLVSVRGRYTAVSIVHSPRFLEHFPFDAEIVSGLSETQVGLSAAVRGYIRSLEQE